MTERIQETPLAGHSIRKALDKAKKLPDKISLASEASMIRKHAMLSDGHCSGSDQ